MIVVIKKLYVVVPITKLCDDLDGFVDSYNQGMNESEEVRNYFKDGMRRDKSPTCTFDFINDDKLGTSMPLPVDESTVIFATSAPNANSE